MNINKEVGRLNKQGELIEKGSKYTTKEALKKDTEILQIYFDGQARHKMIYGKSSQKKLENHLENSNLNSG